MTRWKLKGAYLIDSQTLYFYSKYIIGQKIILQRKDKKMTEYFLTNLDEIHFEWFETK